MVFDILQDQEGFIWVATKNGLNRYDGYEFRVFTNDPYNSHSLSSNTILKLFEDSKGRIWIGTENAGVNVYDKKSGKFFRISHRSTDPRSLSGNVIRHIEEMADGRILVAASEAGLNIVELPPGFFEKDIAPVITHLSLPNETQVYGIGQDKHKQTWIGGMDGTVYRFDPLKNSFTLLINGSLLNNGLLTKDGSVLINNNLFLSDGKEVFPLFDINKKSPGNIIFKPKEKLWENHHRELYFYDISRWVPGSTVQWNVHPPEGLRINYPFIIDRSGILWAGSVGYGLRKYKTASSKFRSYLPGYSVRNIVPLNESEIYLGNYAYGWERLLGDATDSSLSKAIASLPQIDNILHTKSGDLWIKSDIRGYYRYNQQSGILKHYKEINFFDGEGDKQPMLEDSKGFIWFPGLGGRIYRINAATQQIDSFSINTNAAKPMIYKAACTALYEDKQGTYWMGTAEGFARVTYKRATDTMPQITWFYNNSNNRNSLNYNHVSCFLDDPVQPDTYLWICTKGGGLNRLNKITGDFFHLTSNEGLPDDVVYGVLSDDVGNIWGSTNRGIFCMMTGKGKDSTNLTFRNFTKAYGLQDDEFNTSAYAKLPNGNLAFGGVNGLNIFNPKEILAAGFTPPVFITNIMVNNLPVTPGDKTGVLQNNIEETKSITLNYLQDILTLEFSSLDFTAPNQNRYRYQLVGADADWVESGSRRTATYLHLPPGKYTFIVQGSNSQGIWSNKTAALNITVLPPWWRSWPAYICYVLLIALGIRAYFKFSVNRARLRSQLIFEQREAKRIKEIDSLKTQLYTNITHEFRTPLTVILGMAQQVVKNPGEHLANGMDMIIRNGESLLKLVNEMLDLSKLETGKMSLQLTEGDVINFLRYIVESFNSLAESQQKQLHFLSSLDSWSISFDPEKLRQIVSNLLSNALKFTPEKGNIYITISEEKNHKDASGQALVIKVKDTGIGIPENQQQHIFDRFYQLDNSHTRKIDGTGIGLSLTKELVKLMEGSIDVKSPPTGSNKGTEFTVILPVKQVRDGEASHTYTEKKPVSVQTAPGSIQNNLQRIDEIKLDQKPLILLVEDNADVVAYTASCLPDYRLAVGKDGREGFEIATEIIPDLVITDVMMPFVDGFEMCSKLRNDEHTSHIPIIMLTAKADIESRMEGLEQGADAYLEKPFHKEELLLRIRKLLELRNNLKQVYIKRAGLPVHTEQPVTGILTEIAPPVKKAEDDFVKKLTLIVEEHFSDDQFTVEQLCKYVFMSHSQLHRKLDALTGYSPNKFIRMIRLNKATSLLKDPSYTIATIAMECGYNDPGYFARVFKQEYGVTPQEWRLSNQKD